MHRRDLLKAAGASVAALAAPRIGHAERASKLVFVPGTTASVSSPTDVQEIRAASLAGVDQLAALG